MKLTITRNMTDLSTTYSFTVEDRETMNLPNPDAVQRAVDALMALVRSFDQKPEDKNAL